MTIILLFWFYHLQTLALNNGWNPNTTKPYSTYSDYK